MKNRVAVMAFALISLTGPSKSQGVMEPVQCCHIECNTAEAWEQYCSTTDAIQTSDPCDPRALGHDPCGQSTSEKVCYVDPSTATTARVVGHRCDMVEIWSHGRKVIDDELRDGHGLKCGEDIKWFSWGANAPFYSISVRYGRLRDLIAVYRVNHDGKATVKKFRFKPSDQLDLKLNWTDSGNVLRVRNNNGSLLGYIRWQNGTWERHYAQ